MDDDPRPFRSVLYIPGSKARALEKARGLPADAIIFDLEDAVAPDEKPAARALLAETLKPGAFGSRATLLRVNGLDTGWGEDDLVVARSMAVDAVLLPKVNGPCDVDAAAELAPDALFWAMIETAEGVLNALAIAKHPRIRGFVLGTNDLLKELGAQPVAGRASLSMALQTALLAARSAGIPCVDGVYNAFRDEAGLTAECVQGRDFGMDGKTLIHPAQIDIANAVFAPSETDIAEARRVIAAHESAIADGEGVAVLDGKIVENLHVETANRVLAKARAIAGEVA
ncbi:MAG: CoA ester lyase [Paracoccaceae bacterium]|nr:CoA ester lyase [Paracoccaceae bacterium]